MKKKAKTFGKARWLRSKIKRGDLVILRMAKNTGTHTEIVRVAQLGVGNDNFEVITKLGYARYEGRFIVPVTKRYREENPELFI